MTRSDIEKNVPATNNATSIPIITTSTTTTPRPSIQVAAPPPLISKASSSGKERRLSCSSDDSLKKGRSASSGSPCDGTTQDVILSKEEDDDDRDEDGAGAGGAAAAAPRKPGKTGRIMLPATTILILGWWVSSIVHPATQHRWIVQTMWAWFFVLIIIFRFVPISTISRPVSAVWSNTVASAVDALPCRGRLALLWLGALMITFGSAFGFSRPVGTAMSDRVISLAGVYFFQLCIYGLSHNRSAIDWTRIPTSIILQQALALFILKTDAGFSLAKWFNAAVADFVSCAVQATAFIFDPATAGKGWFFVSGLGVIIFVASFVQMLYFFNWMQWLTKQFAWFGQKVLGASGAETFVTIWSPWFGQANSALLVGPYVENMTNSELVSIMTISMSSLSSLLVNSYTKLTFPIPLRTLLAQSVIVMPSAVVNAKMAFPEADPSKVVTRSRESTCAARKKLNLRKAHDLLDCLSDGAKVGLRVAGSVLSNFFSLLALLLFVNGTLVWIFRGFGVHNLDLHQVFAGILYPFVFFLGVPRHEIFSLSYVVAGKLLVSSDFAYAALSAGMGSGPGMVPFSERGFAVLGVALGDGASLASLGIQVGVMTALSPASRKTTICLGGIPALLVATFTSLQAAAIAASVL